MRRSVQPIVTRHRAHGREIEKFLEIAFGLFRVPFEALTDIGLNDADGDAVACRRRMGVEAPDTITDLADDEREREDRDRPSPAPVGENRRGRKDQNGEERDPLQPDETDRLSEHRMAERDETGLVPGKAGEDEAARPFGEAEGAGKPENAPGAVGPDKARKRCRQPEEDRKDRRKAENGERQEPGKASGIDEKGRPQPPETGDEIAEAEGPADEERRGKTPKCPGTGVSAEPIEEPDKDGKGDEAGQGNVEGRQAEGCDGAGENRQKRPAPTAGQHDAPGQRLEQGGPSIAPPRAMSPFRAPDRPHALIPCRIQPCRKPCGEPSPSIDARSGRLRSSTRH